MTLTTAPAPAPVSLDYLLEPQNLMIAAVALVVLVFAVLIVRQRRAPDAFLAFETSAGPVMVSRGAINDLVQRASLTVSGVGKAVCKVRMKKEALELEVRIQHEANAKLRDVANVLTTQLAELLDSNLGIERLGAVRVVVTGIVGTPTLPTRRKMQAEPDPFEMEHSGEEMLEDELEAPR